MTKIRNTSMGPAALNRLQAGPEEMGPPKPEKQQVEQDSTPREVLDKVLDKRAEEFADHSLSGEGAGGQSLVALRAAIDKADAGVTGDKAASVADDTHGTLRSAFLYTSPPGEPGASTAPTKNLDVSADDRTVSATASGGGHSVSASLDRFGLSVDATRHDPEHSVNAGLFVMKDWMSVWVSGGNTHADGTATGWDIGPYFDPTGGGLAATLSRKNLDGSVYRVGGFGGGNATRSLTDLGPYSGEQPALKGLRGVELQRDLSADLTATPGVILTSALGIGGRLGACKSSTLVYRTHLPPERARELLFEDGNKVVRKLRNNARAIGLKDEPLPPPKLSTPEALQVGDKLTLTTSGSFNGGLALGAPAAIGTVSVLGAVTGDFELSVERVSADQLDVSVVPTKVKGLEVAGRAIVLDLSVARAQARSLAQRFRFDLRDPAAVKAYQALLQGELPGGGASHAVPTKLGELPAPGPLPSGVERGPTEHLVGSGWRSHADVGFTLLTLGATYDHTRWERQVDAGDVQLHESARRIEKKLTVPLSGDETRGVRASVLTASRYQDGVRTASEFARLRLVASVEDSKARGLELNHDIDDINQAFGLKLGHFSQDSLKKSRSIELTCELTAEDLQTLASTDDAALRAAATASDTRASGLLVLKQTLAASEDPVERAQAVQDYVARAGFEGMGALVRLLGVDRVAVTTVDGARSDALTAARAMAFKYAEPIAADASNDELSTRFAEVIKADEKLVRARALTEDDPLLQAEARETALGTLDRVRDELKAVLRTDHLTPTQRQALIDQLERGWTTRWEHRAIEALEQPTASGV